MKILHLGLGRSGTTFLQKEIFPKLALKLNLQILKLDNIINTIDFKNHILENEQDLYKRLPKNFFISHEDLIDNKNEFIFFKRNFEFIKKNFPRDTIIFLTVRSPYIWLNSIYNYNIKIFNVIEEEKFFYNSSNMEATKKNKNLFNLYNFDYIFLIDLIKSYFSKVIIIKQEELEDLNFLKNFNLKKSNIINSNTSKKKIAYNRSLSKISTKFIFYINKFINLKLLENYLNKKKFFFRYNLRFLLEKIDFVFRLKKNKIDKKNIPVDLVKLQVQYDQLKN